MNGLRDPERHTDLVVLQRSGLQRTLDRRRTQREAFFAIF